MKRLVLLSFLVFPLVTSCSPYHYEADDNETRDYSDYQDFYLDNLDNFYKQNEKEYLIEVYFSECPHCYETRTAIFDYLDEYKNGTKEIKLYLFNIENGTNPKGEENRELFKQKPNNYDSEVLKNEMIRTKPTNLSDTYFIGAPSLYHINEGALINLEIGTQDVAKYLNYL